MPAFGSWVEKKVAELEAEDKQLLAKWQDIGARRRAIASQLGFLRESWNLYRADIGADNATEEDVQPAQKLTIADAAAAYLRKHAGEARTKELVEALQK